MNKEYKFTANWFDDVAKPTWEQLFKQISMPKKILEIGCYEGKATTWLCDNVLLGDGIEYHIIDTFEGTLNESGMKPIEDWLSQEYSYIENNFKHNISFHNNINFTIHKGFSQLILPTFKLEETYDFIYIDASHRADDTFVDAYYAHKLLKSGGLIIFDDFGWKDPNNLHIVNSPEFGVRTFCSMYDEEYSAVFHGYQLGLIKK
jgi:predicted O-methyltransferase YrrM